MKTGKLLSIAIAVIILCTSFLEVLSAVDHNTDTLKDTINETVEYITNTKATPVPSSVVIDGELSEWTLISLSQCDPSPDFSTIHVKYKEMLSSSDLSDPISSLKCALTVIATAPKELDSKTKAFVSNVIDECAEKRGIMSMIFALHLINNGHTSSSHTKASLTDRLLSMQHEDGGWSLYGANSDVDVSSMVIQALSPQYNANGIVRSSIDKAVLFLSESQRGNGTFISYGVENAESCAQVVIALTSLNIDPRSDERFIKDRSVFDALQSFRNDDGSYSHIAKSTSASLATEQALCALVSYDMLLRKVGTFFVFTPSYDNTIKSPQDDTTPNVSSTPEEKKPTPVSPKCILVISIIILGAITLGVTVLIKRANAVNICIICVITTALTVWAALSSVQSPGDYYKETGNDEAVGKCTISITCKAISENNNDHESGIILPDEEITIHKGDTVYDVLLNASKKHSIILDINGASKSSAYIVAIENIANGDHGELSGWVYAVNGKNGDVGCGNYPVKDGDIIEWQYTTDLIGEFSTVQ